MTYTSKKKPALFLATEVTAVLGKTTSQKEFHPRPAVGLFSRVCSTNPLAEYPVNTKIMLAKPLKISSRPPNAIDVVLKRTGVTGY